MPRKPRKTEGVFERKPGSGVWYARWYDELGRDKKRSVGTKTAAEAYLNKQKEEARLRKLGLLGGRSPGRGQNRSLIMMWGRPHQGLNRISIAYLRDFEQRLGDLNDVA